MPHDSAEEAGVILQDIEVLKMGQQYRGSGLVLCGFHAVYRLPGNGNSPLDSGLLAVGNIRNR